jgi:autophagy-related protein 27
MSYFALGAYYNYSTYGATGLDMMPWVPLYYLLGFPLQAILTPASPRHRDFWREVPYMLRDVVNHLCASFRPRHSSRGGYIVV